MDLSQKNKTWKSINQPFERRALTMAAYQDKVYVIAGLNPEGAAVRTVNIYDPTTQKWAAGPDIPNGIMNGFTPAACVSGGKLYLSPADGHIYMLDDKGSAWQKVGSLKHGRVVHRLVAIGPDKMLALGGSVLGLPTAESELVVPNKQ